MKDYIAKQRGLLVSEERIFHEVSLEVHLGSIQVQLTNVEGNAKDGIPHLSFVRSFSVDVSLA